MIHGEKFAHEGKQYTYYAPDAPVIFDPPVEALVWDGRYDESIKITRSVGVFDPRRKYCACHVDSGATQHMALPAPDDSDDSDELMTNEELAELLACGYGVWAHPDSTTDQFRAFNVFFGNEATNGVPDTFKIKRFRSSEWIKPTKRVYREFMAEIGRPA